MEVVSGASIHLMAPIPGQFIDMVAFATTMSTIQALANDMKAKMALYLAAVTVAIAATGIVLRFQSDRRAAIARADGCRAALDQTLEQFSRYGPDVAFLHTEAMVLYAHRHYEMLQEHPFARWWPAHTHGSYERLPFWERPTRKERLNGVRARIGELHAELGMTNRQQEAELLAAYFDIVMEANTALQATR